MKTNNELKAALHMVLARLESDPKTEAEWQAIRSALVTATAFAKERQKFWSPRCAKCGELHLFTDDVCKPARCPTCGREPGAGGLVDNACCATRAEREVSRRRAGRKP